MSHIKQKHHSTCGAVCIRMIFQPRRITGGIKEIFKNISVNYYGIYECCRNVLMTQYLLNRGFQSSVVSVKNLKKVLEMCKKNHIHVILHIRPGLKSKAGHCVLCVDSDSKYVFVNDPGKNTGNTKLNFKLLEKLMTPLEDSAVVRKNTLILVNTYKKQLPEAEVDCKSGDNSKVKIFECIKDYAEEVICPKHDHWIKVDMLK